MFDAIIFGKELKKKWRAKLFFRQSKSLVHDTKRDKSCFSYIYDGTKLSPILQWQLSAAVLKVGFFGGGGCRHFKRFKSHKMNYKINNLLVK